MDANSKHLSGFNAVNAIAWLCMSLRGIKPAPGQIERYNYDTQKGRRCKPMCFPDLVGKPYRPRLAKNGIRKMRSGQLTGETGWRLELVAPFRAADEFTSSEILDRKTKQKKLASIVAMLKDRPLKKRPAHVSAAAGNILLDTRQVTAGLTTSQIAILKVKSRSDPWGFGPTTKQPLLMKAEREASIYPLGPDKLDCGLQDLFTTNPRAVQNQIALCVDPDTGRLTPTNST